MFVVCCVIVSWCVLCVFCLLLLLLRVVLCLCCCFSFVYLCMLFDFGVCFVVWFVISVVFGIVVSVTHYLPKEQIMTEENWRTIGQLCGCLLWLLLVVLGLLLSEPFVEILLVLIPTSGLSRAPPRAFGASRPRGRFAVETSGTGSAGLGADPGPGGLAR